MGEGWERRALLHPIKWKFRPGSRGATHRNPGLDAREKLTPVKTESKMAVPILHPPMMSHPPR